MMHVSNKDRFNLLSNLKISTKLFFLVFFLSLAVLIVGTLGIYVSLSQYKSSQELLEEVDLARQAQVAFKIQVQEWKNTLLRGQSRKDFEKYRKQFEDRGKEVQSILSSVEAYHQKGSPIHKEVKELEDSLRNLDRLYLETLQIYDSDDPESIFLVDSRVRGKDREPTRQMDELVENIKIYSKEQAESTRSFFLFLSLFVLVGSIIVGGLLGIMVARSVIRPLTTMIDRMKDLSEGEGDLTRRIHLETTEELGTMAGYLDTFLNQIHEIIKNITENSEKIFDSSGTLSETSESMSTAAEELSQQTQSISAAVTQMDKNLQVISSSVEEMTLSIQEMAKRAAEGASTTNLAMQISERMNSVIQELGANAREIGGVIDTIVSIADQTNLLALNASIEAAGAGDAGRGFAVVANEVKELARQASESSDTVRDRIRNIQKSVEQSVLSIEEISRIIADVTEINNNMAGSVEEQSITSRELSSNIMQLTTASGEIATNTENVSQATSATTRDAARTSQESKNLRELSQGLRNLVERFKV